MATTDVITISSPDVLLSQQIAFSNVIVEAAPSPAAAANVVSANSRFALNNKAFIDLQLCLKAAQNLPRDDGAFETEFPRVSFSIYLGDELWGRLRAVLSGGDGIYKNCETFQTTTIVDMRTLCGGLVNFSSTVKESSAIIDKHLPILTDIKTPTLNLNDPNVSEAMTEIMRICDDLKNTAITNKDKADSLAKAFAVFKAKTEDDGRRLNLVADEALPKLPDWEKLRADTKAQIEEAIVELKNCFQKQVNLNRSRGYPQGRCHICFPIKLSLTWNTDGMLYTSELGYSGYVSDEDMLKKLKAIDSKIAGYFKEIEGDAATALKLRSRATALTDSVKGIQETLQAGIQALNTISGVFSTFTSEIEKIVTLIGSIGGQINQKYAFGRRMAIGTFTKIAGAWEEVYEAAKYYQDNGALLARKAPSKTAPPVFGGSSEYEIVGANFGSQDVTTIARIIYQLKENQIEVPGLIREFGDPWPSMEKVFDMLYKTNKEYRAFLAYEYANNKEFTYILPKNPGHKSIGNSDRAKEARTCSEDGSLGSSSKVDILDIVWGLSIVSNQNVNDYISRAAGTNGVIEWNNDNMGGDTWRNSRKTSTIYYRHKGTTAVRQISGKEGTRTVWSLP
ncbi:hypothetical protein GQ44DRAFT_769635 [Phaeosphaeriaceae sp. PMI808]|nr:hypothetical protein GQ44DRAFT_769635 [Phaeosphaeriaceae sp. PMI808]